MSVKLEEAPAEVLQDHQPNAVEQLIASEFSAPELWGQTRKTIPPEIFGLGAPWSEEYNMPLEGELVVTDPQKLWVASLYGIRCVPDTEASTLNAVKLEATSLEGMVKIHEQLEQTVLAGEDSRTAKLVTPPFPDAKPQSDEDKANNTVWLIEVKDGHWPIMLMLRSDGELVYFEHDYADYHLANSLLFPKEVQLMIKEAATHELNQREKYSNGKSKTRTLLLPGEQEHDDSPFGSGARGNKRLSDTGVMKIDNLTDAKHYVSLISYLVAYPHVSVEERLNSLINNHKGETAGSILEIKRLVTDMFNFNTRHREARNATQEEVDQTFAGFLTGVVRAAEKIRGTYQEEAEAA